MYYTKHIELIVSFVSKPTLNMRYNLNMIIHLDFDCYFVSAHRSIDPSLNGKPVVVVSNGDTFSEENSDDEKIAISISYEARKCGIKTTMLVKVAKLLCPNLVVVYTDFKLYKKLSNDIKEYLKTKVPIVEQFSIDEFFCDVTNIDIDPLALAKELQAHILKEFKIPISLGISSNKWIAKMATSDAKPFGLLEVTDNARFIEGKDINELTGIGKSVSDRLKRNGIKTLNDIVNSDSKRIKRLKLEPIYERLIEDSSGKLKTTKIAKSHSTFRTFKAMSDKDELIRRLAILSRLIAYDMHIKNLKPRGLVLNIKYRNSKTQKSANLNNHYEKDIFNSSLIALEKVSILQNITGIGITLKNFQTSDDLFTYNQTSKVDQRENVINSLRDSYGVNIIFFANELKSKKTNLDTLIP